MKKRVRRKGPIRNNAQCSTKREESDEKDEPFSMIPLDLKVEIFLKLPAKSIAKLTFVSKHWSSIIRGKDFTDLYLTRSSTRRRLLFLVYRRGKQFFHSYSQEDPSSDYHRVIIIIPDLDPMCEVSSPIRGLVCCQDDSRVVVGNPTTGQFLTLPRVKTRRRGILTFLGYDPVNDVYKVLCMTVTRLRYKDKSRVLSKDHQVFTLGAEQQWRMIKCEYPHRPHPRTKGLCMNGVVYYLASFNSEHSLISFDLRSEDFNVVKVPEDAKLGSLVNYRGKIALASLSCYNGTLDLWILEDASKEEWSKASFLVPSWTDLVRDEAYS